MMKHDKCNHPSTPAARAACRKAQGAPVATAKAPQEPADASKAPRRASRRAPRVNVPAGLTGLRDKALAKGFECATRTGYDITTHMLDMTSPSGVLTIAWLDTDDETLVTTFRPQGTSVTYRQSTIAEGWEKLCSE